MNFSHHSEADNYNSVVTTLHELLQLRLKQWKIQVVLESGKHLEYILF